MTHALDHTSLISALGFCLITAYAWADVSPASPRSAPPSSTAAREVTASSDVSPQTSKNTPTSRDLSKKKPPSSWRSWLNGRGARIKFTQGRVSLTSTDQRSNDDNAGSLARGEASLQGYGLSLASRSRSGWQISPTVGVDSLLSVLEDEVTPPEKSENLAGRVIGASCSWAGADESGSCLTSNMYEIEMNMIYAGIWAGYISPSSPWSVWPSIHGQYKIGVEWNPLNVIWAQTRLNDVEMSDETYFTWRGGLYLQAELIAEWARSGWMLSLGAQFGHLATLSYSEPLEFRGASYCDESGCSRRRTYADETLLEMWSVSLSLIKTWDSF